MLFKSGAGSPRGSARQRGIQGGNGMTAQASTPGTDLFEDLHPPYTGLQAMVESARCLYCYDAPCVTACPTAIDIPGFIRKIGTGNAPGAARTILSANIMGGTCARACPTEVLCERACVRNQAEGEPVRIGRLQRFAVDALLANPAAPYPFTRAPESGRRIAVIGAGPAGLSCAHRAAMMGHTVTVFEARQKPGGLNEYGLAAYKMTGDFARREIDFLLRIGGIELRHGQQLGRDFSLDQLCRDYDAVFIGVGLGGVNRPALPGADLPGVRNAVDFIADLRQATDPSSVTVGRSVVVIGGGNTAIDAAIQARRLGAESVTLAYRRGAEDMSATPWEQDLAKTSDVSVRYWAAPVAMQGKDAVAAVRFERTQQEQGRLAGTGQYFDLPADMVLLAVGQTLAEGPLAGLALQNGKILTDADGQTSREGVYAGGDCIAAGSDLTVQAVEDGKRAALAIHQRLGAKNAEARGRTTNG